MIKILIGGSPCTYWSIAQKANRETKAEGLGWELFKNYLIAKQKFQPDFFLYENNKSAAQPIKDQIASELGVDLMYINSALVSAQNRQRFYAFNWHVEQPEDRGIHLSDILESGIAIREKAYTLDANYYKTLGGNVGFDTQAGRRKMVAEPIAINTTKDGKALALRATDDHIGQRDLVACAERFRRTGVAEPVGIGYRNRREDDGKLYRRFETSGEPKANALTTVQTDSMVAEPIRIGTIENDAKTKGHDSKQYRVYSPEGKATTLCGEGGGLGAKTGLYATPIAPGDCIPINTTGDEKSQTIKAQYGKNSAVNFVGYTSTYGATGVAEATLEPTDEQEKDRPVYQVIDGEIEIKGKRYPIKLPDGYYIIRKLTPVECERLQTLPDNYTAAVSATQRYRGLGNGWTAEVIIHILTGALKDVPKDEEIVVLSMYDGIGTGRYGSVIVVQHVDSAHFFHPKKCGTIPRQSTLGGLVDDSGVVAGEGSGGHKFDAPNAGTKVSGTYPRPGTLGSITDAGAVAGEGSLPSIFEPGHSGDEIAGTFPRRTTIGETTTAGAEAGQQTAGSHFTPKIAGTLPRAGTLGGVIPGNGAQAGEATDPSFFTPRKAEGTLGGAIPGSNAKAGESTATSYFAPKQAGTEQKAEGTLGSVQTAEAATVETNDARSFGCIKCGTERCGK